MREQVVLKIKGYPINVEITFGTRRFSNYRYAFGEIYVREKMNTPLSKIEKNLNSSFALEKIQKFNPEPLIDGNYAYILGEIERVYPTRENTKDLKYIKLAAPGGKRITARDFLKNYIQKRVSYYERIMGLGPHKVEIRHYTAALGKNYVRTKELFFNEKLIHFSEPLIDQVVIHELCHDFYLNHSPAFYNKLKYYCPDYEERRLKLIYGVRK